MKIKEFFKRLWNSILFPNTLSVILFLFFSLIVLASAVLLSVFVKTTWYHYFLYVISALCIMYIGYLIYLGYKKIKPKILDFIETNKRAQLVLKNKDNKTIFFTALKIIVDLGYVILFAVLFTLTLSLWYGTLAVLYLVYLLSKLGIVLTKVKSGNDELEQNKSYLRTGVLLICTVIPFSGSIVLIYTMNMSFAYSGLLIYAVATWAFYKIISASIKYFKDKNNVDLYVKSIRNINLASALISIETLQVALFHSFSPGSNQGFANGTTGGVVVAMILALGIYMIIKAHKRQKVLNES